MPLHTYPHIVFDLDGTLVDSRRDLSNAANALITQYGRQALPQDSIVNMVGEGARKLVERAIEAAEVSVPIDEALQTFLELYEERLTEHTRPYDGIVSTLESLADRRCLSLLTNKPEGSTRRLLDALDLARYFQSLVAGDERFPRKPAPEGLRYLIEQAGVTPDETLLVGDSWVDLHTARAAGTDACLVRYGFGFRAVSPLDLVGVHIIDRPEELLRVAGGEEGEGVTR